MNKITLILFSITLLVTNCKVSNEKETKEPKEKIIKEHVYDCADKINYYDNMQKYQDCLDEGLKKDDSIAYLWQQKAMPYFKIKKYDVGMGFLDKAVKLDKKRYLPYRAFIKCIFSKNYSQAINDFEECINTWGDNYEMDHTYTFYISLSYLQLKEFEKAENYLQKTINEQKNSQFKEAHHLDLFYYGISLYEQQKYKEAISVLDEAIKQYPKFSDAIYYKAICLKKLNKNESEYLDLIKQAEIYLEKGYTINEDNAVYETYPYQYKK